jgi:hypothetical protein
MLVPDGLFWKNALKNSPRTGVTKISPTPVSSLQNLVRDADCASLSGVPHVSR